jgi:hypothetical protein
LWRNIKRHGTKVNLLIRVCARHNEEKTRPLGPTSPESPQPEYDSPFILLNNLHIEGIGQVRSEDVLLDHLDTHAEGEGDGHQKQEEGEGSQDQSDDSRPFWIS